MCAGLLGEGEGPGPSLTLCVTLRAARAVSRDLRMQDHPPGKRQVGNPVMEGLSSGHFLGAIIERCFLSAAGEGRLPLPKNTSSDDRPSAGQRAGKVRHQSRGASSRGGRRPHPGKSVMVEKTQHCPPEAPGTRSPLHSSPTTSSAFGLNPPPEDPSILQAVAQEEQALTMCAKNIKVSSSGEKVVMWTR